MFWKQGDEMCKSEYHHPYIKGQLLRVNCLNFDITTRHAVLRVVNLSNGDCVRNNITKREITLQARNNITQGGGRTLIVKLEILDTLAAWHADMEQ